MPYRIAKAGDKFQVERADNGEPVGKPHDTEEEAKKHLAALEANVPDAQESARVRMGYFAELADLTEAEINSADKTVRTTLIKPGWSANGRYYSKPVLKEAARLFEGGKAYADHPGKSESRDRPERSIRDLVGWYSDVKQETDGRLTASLHVIDDKVWPIVEAAVTKNASLAGVSINALGNTKLGEAEGKKGVIVEAIVKHNSTDIVTTPAAGGKFESLLASDSDTFTRDLIEAMSLDELKEILHEARQDLVKAWQNEWKTPRDEKALKAARDEAKSLKDKLTESTKQIRTMSDDLAEAKKNLARLERELMVDRLLANSKLTPEWKSALKEELEKAPDETAIKEILEREAKKATAVRKPLKLHGAGASVMPSLTAQTQRPNPIAEALNINPNLVGISSYAEFKRRKQLEKL